MRVKNPDALTLFFGSPGEEQPAAAPSGPQQPRKERMGSRGRREGQPGPQDDAALKLWLMANSPAKALRILKEYAAECAKECNEDREFRAAGVWIELGQQTEKVLEWTYQHPQLCG